MMQPDENHQGGRMTAELSFDLPTYFRSDGSRTELREFIQDALECWGGQRRPEDGPFHSLGQVTVKFKGIERVTRSRSSRAKEKSI
jgi:hypothetical protein